jgi:hypothetical protein
VALNESNLRRDYLQGMDAPELLEVAEDGVQSDAMGSAR